MGQLEHALRTRRGAGGACFVPYLTGGFPGVDAALLRAVAEAGADAIEVGVPHSDPVMDGGVIQQASSAALGAGATPARVMATVREASLDIPVSLMTYVNPVLRRGVEAFLDEAKQAGVSGMIVPDLPVDEAQAFDEACAERDIDAVLLAAPGATPARLAEIARRARGFVYCVATYGVTGARGGLGPSSARPHSSASRPCGRTPTCHCWSVSASARLPRHTKPRRSPMAWSSAAPSCRAWSTAIRRACWIWCAASAMRSRATDAPASTSLESHPRARSRTYARAGWSDGVIGLEHRDVVPTISTRIMEGKGAR
jgi:tryptophan synthase alpha chain